MVVDGISVGAGAQADAVVGVTLSGCDSSLDTLERALREEVLGLDLTDNRLHADSGEGDEGSLHVGGGLKNERRTINECRLLYLSEEDH